MQKNHKNIFRTELFSKKSYPLSGLESYLGEVVSVARQLTKTHRYAFRVRRSSDNAVMDIGFTKQGELDTATLLKFCGASSGFVQLLYGCNGSTFANDNTGKEPRVVNSGILDRDFDTVKANVMFPTFASASSVNLIVNGDFANGKTNWLSNPTVTWVVENSIAKVTNMGSTGSYKIYQQKTVTVGSRYCLIVEMKTNNSNNNIQMNTSGNVIGNVWHTGSNNWERLIAIGTATTTTLEVRILNSNVFGDISATPVEIRYASLIDITNYGKPSMVFDGSNDALWCANSSEGVTNINTQPLYLSAVMSNFATTGYIICKNTSTSIDIQYRLYNYTSYILDIQVENTSGQSLTNAFLPNVQNLQSGTWKSNAINCYINGVQTGNQITYTGLVTARDITIIGARYNTGNTQVGFFTGKLSEFCILKGNPKQLDFETKTKKYYGIV